MFYDSFPRFLLIVVVFSLGISTVYSTCAVEPAYFEIKTGGNDIGSYEIGDQAHIKANLEESPLEIDAVFHNTEPQCFDNEESMEMRLTSSSVSVNANSLTQEQVNTSIYESRFSFEFSGEGVVLSNYFQMQYSLENSQYFNGITFLPDNSAPIVNIPIEEKQTINPSAQISFDYSIEDRESGLKRVVIGSDVFNLDGNSTFESSFNQIIEETTNFQVRAVDRVGHQTTKNFRIIVDDQGPQFSDYTNLGYGFDDVRRTISFSVRVTDLDFNEGDSIEETIKAEVEGSSGVLSQLSTPTSCEFIGEGIFECIWEDVVITSTQTKQIQLTFSGVDSLGNQGSKTFTPTIFVDTQEPKINDFYVENSVGKKNLISGHVQDGVVYLEFEDQSLDSGVSVYPQFDILTNFDIPRYYCGPGCYMWDISDYVQEFKEDSRATVPFRVTVADTYGNSVSSTLDVNLDNTKPNIENISFQELSDVKDKTLKSNELIDIEVVFNEPNFQQEEVFADLVAITGDSSNDRVTPRCREIEDDKYSCWFEQVRLGTGPFTRNATIVVNDDAGNRAVGYLPLEVLKSNEGDTPTAFAIDDMEIINPLNRNLILEMGDSRGELMSAWFEGSIDSLDPKYDIVNYNIEECSESFLGGHLPINRNSPSLYPTPVRTILDEGNISEFAIETIIGGDEELVSGHSNVEILQDMELECTIFILFRDDTTLYEEGNFVNFSLQFSFYDLPRGNALEANAYNLKEKIDDTKFLGSKFDDIYEVYNTLSTVCNALSTAGSIYSGFKEGFNFVTNGLKTNVLTYGAGKAADEATTPAQGAISELGFAPGGVTDKLCSYLTCEWGTLPVTTDILNSINGLVGGAICSAYSAPSNSGGEE